ncbi:MAG: hypothetical protein HPY71_03905 [Firmicutes bacterium]|nr:hypothetical protein [Bacillota bacterium]
MVLEGQVITSNLRRNNLTAEWLMQQLQNRGTTADQVMLAALDTQGNLYLDKYNDYESPSKHHDSYTTI